MIVQWFIQGRPVSIDTSQGKEIAIPLEFNGPQPNTYGVPRAQSVAYRDGTFVGDTREGGSCNFETYTLTPHCNGTHTEGIGHLTKERIPVQIAPEDCFIPACLISIQPVSPEQTNETYTPALNPDDRVITKAALTLAMDKHPESRSFPAIMIRTLPNSREKKSRDYMEMPPPFLTHEAMQYLAALPLRHLLTDIPSLDRLFDEGLLSNHRIWWNLTHPDAEINLPFANRTVTEMIFLEDTVADGLFILNLQLAPFVGDATPSRPVIFPIQFS
jgi:arylformamidase